MKMFVANATKQAVQFLYRIPESSGVRAQDIPIGGQVQLSQDLPVESVNMIVEQHQRYGMVEAAQAYRSKGFAGLCYSLGSPVKMDTIAALIDHNTDMLVELGQKIRQESAVSANNVLDSEDFRPPGLALRNFEASVHEVERVGQVDTPFEETISVSRDAPEKVEKSNRQQRRGRR
jgi:hypothetical protein